MSNQDTRLIPLRRSAVPAVLTLANGRHHTADTIMRAWLEGKSEHTIRNYQHDLEAFALFLSRSLGISPPLSVTAALTKLARQSAPSAHEIGLLFRHWLRDQRHMAAASVNRHVASLKSVMRLGQQLGLVNWRLDFPGVRAEKRRPTIGPTVEQVRQILATTSGNTEADTRDCAIVLTFYCLGLRVQELCGLTLEDTDLERGSTWIRGKGRRERELVPMPVDVAEAIRRYLVFRGTARGPLFQTRGLRGLAQNGRLETRSVLRIVRNLGQRIGVHVTCHSLRHTSITQAAELGQRAGLGLDKIRAHSRHRNITTLMVYIDQHHQAQTQRTLADLVAGSLHESEAMSRT